MGRTALNEFWVIFTLFMAGFLIRLQHLAAWPLTHDEIWAAMLWINGSPADTLRTLSHWEFPPLYYLFLNVWSHVFGNSEWVLRFPSALFSSLTIIIIYKLGKELFNEGVGIISALLLLSSPFALPYAQYAKMYSLFWFLSAAAFLFFFRFLKGKGRNSLKLYIITSILCCYTMYTGFLLLAAQNGIFWLTGDRARRGKWSSAQLIILCLCLPWIIFFLGSRHGPWDSLRPAGLPVDYGAFFLQSFLMIIGTVRENWLHVPVNMTFGALNGFLYIFLIAYLLIDVFAASDKNRKAGLPGPVNYQGLLLWMAIPVLVYFLFDYFFIHAGLGVRYLGFLQVPIILLVSSQLGKFPRFIKVLLIPVMVCMSVNNVYAYLNDPPQDWRKTATELNMAVGKNDIVLSLVSVPIFKYYYKGNTSMFFMVSRKDCSLGILIDKGIVDRNVRSIFVLYHHLPKPEIKLNGFSLEYNVFNGGVGFLHYQRMSAKSD